MDEWIPTDHGIENEPVHQRPGTFRSDPTEELAAETLEEEAVPVDTTGRAPSQSVHEEVHTLHAAREKRGQSWGEWYLAMRAQTSRDKSIVAVVLIALLGGPLAILGTFWANIDSVISTIIFSPTIEEVMKIGLLALIVETRPYLILGPLQIRFAAFLSALAFAGVENLLYVFVYLDDPSDGLVLWRWTVCVLLHVVASSIAAEGLVRAWNRSRETLKRPTLDHAYRWLFFAIAVHGAYNLAVTVWELAR